MTDHTRSGFVAIVGRPNVGKSTLLNALIGEKVAIVSDKPQTTRTRITGVLTREEAQIVFVDTPGMHRPRTKLSEHMVGAIRQSVGDVDAAILVVEAMGKVHDAERELIDQCKGRKVPLILAINKIDALDRKELLIERIVQFTELYNFAAIVPISAKESDGMEALLGEIEKLLPEGPHFFPDDTLTDQPERVIAAEMIREKLLVNLEDEVPHGIAVTIEKMKERPDSEILDIDAVIYCERESHKGIVIGKGGTMLKKVASAARADIEAFFDSKVNLQCWVKVKEDWRNREGLIHNFGLDQ